jgi:hypothetical protein
MSEIELPAFQAGGRVDRTGLALVHEGEYVVPAAGSEAEIAALPGGGGAPTAYHFPIEVEVIGTLGEQEKRELVDRVFAELDAALRGQGA